MLEGIKVVEFATYVAGPSAATVMADWGASVIKIESKVGDATRHLFAALPELTGNPVFEFENRGKRGVVLDTGTADGREALIAILRDTDIFITNLRPGALKRARIDYESLKDLLPNLIYCSVSGYGLQGEAADLPAFDMAALWTRTGLGGASIPQGVDPFPCRPGMGDSICALSTSSACLAALVERGRTGQGRLVETSLVRSGVYAVGWDMSIQLKWDRANQAMPRKEVANPLSNYFMTSDQRWFLCMVRGLNDWAAIAKAAGRVDLLNDPRFETPALRVENKADLIEALDQGFGQLTLAEATARLTVGDVIWAPLQTPAQAAQDEYLKTAGCFVEIEDRFGERYLAPASPARFPGAQDLTTRPAPGHGQHTCEVLAEAGYSPAQIEAMLRSGAASVIEA